MTRWIEDAAAGQPPLVESVPCPECNGRGARVLPSACAETECSVCEGTGEKGGGWGE